MAGPFFYKENQRPRYELGIWSVIVSHLLEVAIILVLRFFLMIENRRRDKIQAICDSESEEDKLAREIERNTTTFSGSGE